MGHGGVSGPGWNYPHRTSPALLIAAMVSFCVLLAVSVRAEEPPSREIGCFADNKEADPLGTRGRDLDGAVIKDPAMTVKQCLRLCQGQGFKYAGLQDGSWCFCGNSYGRHKTGDANCTTKCAGDQSQNCGGEWANSIWELDAKSTALPGTATGPSAGASSPARVPTVPEEVQRAAAVIPVGKWPEGLAFDGTSLWVAESGGRRIAQIDPDRRRVVRRAKVGRLPVDMVSGSSGRIFALVHTDKKIWLQKGRSGRTFARIPQCPNAMTGNGGTLYVLAWGNCASSEVLLYEVDANSGKVRKIINLSANSYGIANAEGTLWTVHGATIARINPDSGKVSETWQGNSLNDIVSNGQRVFLSGFKYKQGVVIAFDNSNPAHYRRQILAEPITALAATPAHVVAFGNMGTIWVMSADDLGIVRVITTDFGFFEAKAALALDDTLYVTTFRGQGQDGSVLVIKDWQPSERQHLAAAAPEVPATWQ